MQPAPAPNGDRAKAPPAEAAPPMDGRTARRERGRAAVIDAMFEALQAGRTTPKTDDLARRAGVSEASVFRYFDGIEDLERQTFERFTDRFGSLFVLADADVGDVQARLSRLVTARLDAYREVGAILAVGRARAAVAPVFAEARAAMRALQAEQVRAALAPEIVAASPAAGADLVALVDALTSPESWEVMRSHDRTRNQIRRAWLRGTSSIVATHLPS